MANIETRLERLETELRFRVWVHRERIMEGMSEEELNHLAATGLLPTRPAPPPGTSKLDGLDRKTLLRLWEEDEREILRLMLEMRGRSEDEHRFHSLHDHWPEQGCDANCLEVLRARLRSLTPG